MTMTHAVLAADDKLVLAAIRGQGDPDLSVPRHTLLYFYPKKGVIFGAKKALTAVADTAKADGWTVGTLKRNVLVIECSVAVDEDAVAERSEWANALADANGVEFDGWECAVNIPA